MKSIAFRLFPLLILLFLGFVFWRGLGQDPRRLPSMYLNKKLPDFTLPLLDDHFGLLTNKVFKDKYSLLNIFASWCVSCAEEQAFLLKLAKDGIPLYGINYKDSPIEARQWLKSYGNPYMQVGEDREGLAAIDLGVYGTPETFLMNNRGQVLYRYAGVLDNKIWQAEFVPRIKAIEKND